MRSLPELPPRSLRFIIAALFLLAAFLVYGASLKNGFVQWDDGLLIYNNPAVMEMSWGSIKRAFTTYDPELYIPLTLLSYQLDYQLGDGTPFMFHLQNLLLHAGNALLVAWLAYLLLRNKTAGLLVGLLFLVHPLHTEAVAWASARKDVLATIFFLGSIIAYLYSREREQRNVYILSIALFLLGLLSKVVVLTLPVILLLILWRNDGKITRKDLIDTVPYFALSVAFGIIAMLGKTEVSASSTLLEKILMAGKSSVFYLEKLFVPLDLTVLYPYLDPIVPQSPDFYIPAAIVVALLVGAIILLRYSREPLAWLLFYFITLAPTFINIAKGEQGDVYFASDRYAYIPSIGIFLLVIGSIIAALQQADNVKAVRARSRILTAVVAVVLLLFASLACRQSKVWASGQALFEHALAHAPAASYVAHNNLGNTYRLQGKWEEAIEQYEASLRIRPHARTYSNLGATYRKLGRSDKALDAYRKALEIDPGNALAHFGLGIVHAARAEDELAFASYQRALELDPDSGEVYTNIGALHARRRESAEAIAAYKKAIELNPMLADAYYNLGIEEGERGNIDEAIAAYLQALDLRPKNISARINLAILYGQKDDLDGAIEQFEEILNIDPQNSTAKSALTQLRKLR